MARAPDEGSNGDPGASRSPRWCLRIAAGLLAAILIAAAVGWFTREDIADRVIEDVLEDQGIPASYEIVEIGPQEQVLANIIVGDPERPDLAIERAVIGIDYTFGFPAIGDVKLVRPRLYGTWGDGRLSFGALDPLLEPGEGEPGLPAINLELVDGRALISSDYGEIGIKAEGSGPLDDGFAGIIAATAPGIGSGECRARRATLYGEISTDAGEPSFAGPIRLGGLLCGEASIERAAVAARISLPSSLDAVDGGFDIEAQGLVGGGFSARTLAGSGRVGWSGGVFNLRHDLVLAAVDLGFARFGEVHADGAVRSVERFARCEWDAEIAGEGIALAAFEGAQLATLEESFEGSLLAPLFARFTRNFEAAMEDGTLRADLNLRDDGEGLSLVVPEARLASGEGETILAASRVSWAKGALRGNLMTGGAGLPRITGRMEQAGRAGELVFRLAMAPYEARSASGVARLAVPRMELRQTEGGLAFAGLAEASGPIPGGSVESLRLPLAGSWSGKRGFALGPRCVEARFESLSFYDFSLGPEWVELCPDGARAMLVYDDALRFSLASPELDFAGNLGGTRLHMTGGSARISYPGGFALDEVDVVLGEEGAAVRLAAATLTGELADTLAGKFAGGTAAIDTVPLDLAALEGRWAYEDGVLALSKSRFIVSERIEGQARFEPLIARNAALQIDEETLLTEAALREPGSDQVVTRVSIIHDLETAQGRAVLDVPGLVFGDTLAPEDLTYLTKGFVAEVEGTVRGAGLIEWDGDEVTSSGRFRTDDLDLAAAFGPLTGLAGEIVFTDLLALTTAPGQVATIETINPGVEVLDGRIVYSLTDGQIVRLEDARWPFMGGTLIMRPVVLDYGSSGDKAYVFEIVGLEAERFVAEMELTNLSATGTFDGAVPIVFDGEGNGRIEGGLLISRPPGGNVSYVGELTYEDMGAMANFAFNALRSLDYSQMAVALEGNLAGEIITRFTFDSVRQGEGASRNFITRRLSRLPIRFKVNVRSQNFHQLATMVRSFWDADYLGNPIDRGLLKAEEGRFVPSAPAPGGKPGPSPEATRPEDQPVQPPESEESL